MLLAVVEGSVGSNTVSVYERSTHAVSAQVLMVTVEEPGSARNSCRALHLNGFGPTAHGTPLYTATCGATRSLVTMPPLYERDNVHAGHLSNT
jgi:hypothetical protein